MLEFYLSMERIEAIVSGRVQMVMFRDFAQRKALGLRLCGEVMNLPDGTVRVIAVHALRNALVTVVTVIGLQIGALLGGAILTENVFSWPGIAKWLVESISRRDYPALQGGILLIAALVMATNLLVDLLYGVLNPRIRHRR